ncbi:MAG TPA: NAD(P)H-dependent oxidoreductase [Longimicrobium sp.]|jgi:NAD(P)H-dependent FMN reductase|uniref:NADPH-dependent FMN reductase n=1 Tax=Longimicrobium sp. TaxID=2029185 RepID=UPI002ED98897
MGDRAEVRVLAVSGSLRAVSSNGAVVDALALLAPDGVRVEVFRGLDALPHFNPDLERGTAAIPAVEAWRRALRECGAVVICSPEYAHGVPGALKNALDWVVGSNEFYAKPVALVNAAPHARFAQDALAETLRAMGAAVDGDASVAVRVSGAGLDAAGIAADPALSSTLRRALEVLAARARAAAAELADAWPDGVPRP